MWFSGTASPSVAEEEEETGRDASWERDELFSLKNPKTSSIYMGKEREGCLGPSSKQEEFGRAREESTSHKGGGSLRFKPPLALSPYP